MVAGKGPDPLRVQPGLMGLRHTHIHAYDMTASGLTPALITGVVGQLWIRHPPSPKAPKATLDRVGGGGGEGIG